MSAENKAATYCHESCLFNASLPTFETIRAKIAISTRLFPNQLADVLGDCQNLFFLQPSAYDLQTDMGTMVDFWVICGFVSA